MVDASMQGNLDGFSGRFYRLPPVAFPQGMGNIIAALRASMAVRQPTDRCGTFLFQDAKGALRLLLERMHALAPERDQVIIPAYTCYSVAASVVAAGLVVVPSDIRPQTLDYHYPRLARATGARTLAIVAGHLFRGPVNYTRLRGVARNCGAFLIDDAAQGGDDEALETAGADARLHSFGRGKPVSAGGGGLLQVTREPLRSEVARAYARLPGPGQRTLFKSVLSAVASDVLTRPRLYWLPASLPFLQLGVTHYPESVQPLTGSRFVQALLPSARATARSLDCVRRDHARFYAAAFAALPQRQPRVHQSARYAPHRFPVYWPRCVSDLPLRQLARWGVSIMYPSSIDQLRQIHGHLPHPVRPMPGARWLARHVLTLPTHHRLSVRDRQAIVRILIRGGT